MNDDLDLKDPQRLLDELAPHIPYDTPAAWLVLVDQPATAQSVLAVRRLPDLTTRAEEETYDAQRDRSDHLYDLMHSLPIPPRGNGSIRTVAVTVVVRSGRNVFGWQEWAWAKGWRYSNHNTGAFDRDILTVTEHGWSSMMLHEGGAHPRLELAITNPVEHV